MECNVVFAGDRDGWLKARAEDAASISGSEAAAVLGVSPFASEWDVWRQKRGEAPAFSGNEATRRGSRWEGVVLEEYADAADAKVVTPGALVGRSSATHVLLAHREHAWLRQSPDAFAERNGELGQVEAKTARRGGDWSPEPGVVIERWDDSFAALIPSHIAVQAYVQLEVTGLPWNDVCALVPTGGWLGVRWVRVMRDAETQAALVERLGAWRERHLVAGEEPAVDGSDACTAHLASRFPRDEKLVRGATDDEAAMMRELHACRASKDAAEERAKALCNELIASAAGAKLTFPGGAKAPYGQPQKCGGGARIDADALRSQFPDVAAAVTRQTAPSMTFRTYRMEG